jgi:hypothetical protein
MQAIQWGGKSATDPLFLRLVKDWIEKDREVYAMFWFHQAGGTKHHWLFDSFEQFMSVLTSTRGYCTVDVYRHPHFPVRGIVNDELIKRAFTDIHDGEDWFLMAFEEKDHQRVTIGVWGDNTHKTLREELANHVGKFVVIGPDIHWPVAPADYPDEWISGVLNESPNIEQHHKSSVAA